MTEVQRSQSLPEMVPTVSFDVDLGTITNFIDFDYAAFDVLAQQVILSDDLIRAYSVNFMPQPDDDDALGVYHDDTSSSAIRLPEIVRKIESPGKDTVFIASDICYDGGVLVGDLSEIVNGVFLHETGHYRDFNLGESRAQVEDYERRKAAGEGAGLEKEYANWADRPWEQAAIAFKEVNGDIGVVTFEPRIRRPRVSRAVLLGEPDPKLLALLCEDGLAV